MVEMCKRATANIVRRGGKRRDRQTPHTRSPATCQRWLRVWLRHVEFYAVDVTKCLSTYEVLLYTPNWPSSTKYGYKTPKYGTEGRYRAYHGRGWISVAGTQPHDDRHPDCVDTAAMQWQPGGPSRSEITSNFYPVSLSDVTPHDVSLRHVGLVLKLPKLSI